MMEPYCRSLLAVDAGEATAVERTCGAYVAPLGELRDRDRSPHGPRLACEARYGVREPGPRRGIAHRRRVPAMRGIEGVSGPVGIRQMMPRASQAMIAWVSGPDQKQAGIPGLPGESPFVLRRRPGTGVPYARRLGNPRLAGRRPKLDRRSALRNKAHAASDVGSAYSKGIKPSSRGATLRLVLRNGPTRHAEGTRR